jgi:hypothetical protein
MGHNSKKRGVTMAGMGGHYAPEYTHHTQYQIVIMVQPTTREIGYCFDLRVISWES